MRKLNLKNVFTILVMFSLLFASLPTNIFAEAKIPINNADANNIKTGITSFNEPEVGEIVDERTENTKTFYNGEGKYTEKIYFEPIHTKELGDENFKEISPDLVKDQSTTNIVTTENTAIDTDFLKTMSNGKYANFSYEGHSLSLSILQAIGEDKTTLNAKDVDAAFVENTNKIVHKGIFPSIDLQNYTFSQNTKEDLVLHQYDGYHIFKFKLKTDLEAVIEDGSILLKDEDNKKIFELPKPVMSDSNYNEGSGETATSNKVNYEIEKTEEGYLLTLNADPEWLASSERVFPIFIDPTTSVTNSSDTFVMGAYPTTNYSSTTSKWDSGLGEYILKVGNYDSTTGNCYALLNQALPANLNGLTITNATFNAYVTHSASASATDIFLDRNTESWSNSTVTWNTRPSSTNIKTISVAKDQWAIFDVTSTVKSWLGGSLTNYGFKIHENGNGQSYWKKIVSTSNSNNNPYISVNYTIPIPDSPTGKAYSYGDSTNSGYVDLTWDKVPGATGYKILIFNGNNYDEFPVGNVTSWSTKGRKIWPSPSEIASGVYKLHDGTSGGVELPNDPSPLYKKNGNKYPNNINYWFRIKAIYPLGESAQSDPPFKPTIPNLKFAEMTSVKSFTRGNNGYIDLSWKPVSGATGYKFLMYNGKAFESLDIGNVTSWTTKDKKYWPKPTEGYDLHLDDTKSGDELPIDPALVYQKANPNYKPRYYVLKIVPYNDNGETVQPAASYSYIPLIPVPEPPKGEVYANELGSNYGYVNLTWDPIPGATGYKVWVFNGKFYESFDVNDNTSWTSKDKGIWPTADEISSADPSKTQVLHHDGQGLDLPKEPFKLYSKMGTTYATSDKYYFRLSAYDTKGETVYSTTYLYKVIPNEVKPSLETPLTPNLDNYAIDESTGYLDMQWEEVTGADGYKVWIFNGKEYQSFDVGNTLSWSTKDQGIWPTKTEVQAGQYKLHTDRLGSNFPFDPDPVYVNANYQGLLEGIYSIKISAYTNSGINSDFSDVIESNIDWHKDLGEVPLENAAIDEEGFISEVDTEGCIESETQSECVLNNLNNEIDEAQKKIDDIVEIANQEGATARTLSDPIETTTVKDSMALEIARLKDQVQEEKQEISTEEPATRLDTRELTDEDNEDFEEYDYTQEELEKPLLMDVDLNIMAFDNDLNSYTLDEIHDIYTSSSPLSRKVLPDVILVNVGVGANKMYDKKKKKDYIGYHVYLSNLYIKYGSKPTKYVVKRSFYRANHVNDKFEWVKSDTDTMKLGEAEFTNIYVSTTKFRKMDVKVTPYRGKDSYTPIYKGIGKTLYNKKGYVYPKYTNPYSKRKLPVPASAVIPKISQDLQQKRRSEWNSIRPEYRKWFENNYNVKPNWKDSWDCHHILPIQFNGQNNYSNILVMDRKFHQQKVTPWWTNY